MTSQILPILIAAATIAGLSACAGHESAVGDDGSAPVAGSSKTTQALKSLPPKPLEQRVPVAIYQFRSEVRGISATAATDMFTTALVKAGQFRVTERAQLNAGVIAEKQLNAAGHTTGRSAQKALRGARYIFEGAVTEGNQGQDGSQGGVNIGGLNLGGSSNKDVIAIDVRIIDAHSGDVVDSIDVRKALADSGVGVSGTASFANTLASLTGRSASPLTPDVNYQSTHKESLDRALRACIENAVYELARRVDLPADGVDH
jgi:curli biogenesis system outer membrane secretion channel CsgG